jgi:hypothetical protein
VPTEKIADQTFEEIPVVEEKPVEEKYFVFGKFRLKQKMVWFGGGGLIAFLILLLILVNLLKKPSISPKPPSLLTPTPTPFEEEITSPSAYATDSAVLKIEAELKNIDQDLQSTDLKEAGLNPPVLDMEVKFED